MYQVERKMFNLKKSKKRRAIDRLREIDPDIRYSDLELDEKDVEYLAGIISPEKETKIAVHGRGDNWTEVGPGYSPYNTSPLVNSTPEFGGRWKKNFPGSGDQHINDDGDKSKSTRGTGTNDDFNPVLKRDKINREIGRSPYKIMISLTDDQSPSEQLAKELLGDDGKHDNTSIFVEVDDFQHALEIERDFKSKGLSVTIEPR